MPVGIPIQVSDKIVVPYTTQEKVKGIANQLKESPLLAVTLWTVMHHGHNTKTGHMLVNYALLNETYPVVVMNLTVVKCFMAQFYTGFNKRTSTGVTMEDLHEVIAPFCVKGLEPKDYDTLNRLTGCNSIPVYRLHEKKGVNSGNFAISLQLWGTFIDALQGIATVKEMLHDNQADYLESFCTDRSFTVQHLKQIFPQASAEKMLKNTKCSTVGAAHWHLGERDKVYDDLTPSLGRPWDKGQLDALRPVMNTLFGKEEKMAYHMLNVWTPLPAGQDIYSREQVNQSYPIPPQDGHVRGKPNRAYLRDTLRQAVRDRLGIFAPKAGRPCASDPVQRADRKKIEKMRNEFREKLGAGAVLNKRKRHKKEEEEDSDSDDDEEVSYSSGESTIYEEDRKKKKKKAVKKYKGPTIVPKHPETHSDIPVILVHPVVPCTP